jgi:hypothetical protein
MMALLDMCYHNNFVVVFFLDVIVDIKLCRCVINLPSCFSITFSCLVGSYFLYWQYCLHDVMFYFVVTIVSFL